MALVLKSDSILLFLKWRNFFVYFPIKKCFFVLLVFNSAVHIDSSNDISFELKNHLVPSTMHLILMGIFSFFIYFCCCFVFLVYSTSLLVKKKVKRGLSLSPLTKESVL